MSLDRELYEFKQLTHLALTDFGTNEVKRVAGNGDGPRIYCKLAVND